MNDHYFQVKIDDLLSDYNLLQFGTSCIIFIADIPSANSTLIATDTNQTKAFQNESGKLIQTMDNSR